MIVTLPPHLEALIHEKVAEGAYPAAAAVVEDALRLLDERDRLARLRAAIAVGDAQIARGEGIPYTPELLAKIDREVDARLARGDQPSPDVCP